jgi:diguanylate cyclase (GGDEF)-like protein
VLDPATGQFRNFRHDPDNPDTISTNSIYSLHEDKRGHLWVGTRGGGLNLVIGSPFRQEGLRFRNFSEREGLPNSTVYGIESDTSGHLWLSTNRGLSRFSPEQQAFRNFRRSHGLQSDEFNFGAHYRSASGELFFGGSRGYNAFVPERLRFNDQAPPVVLTSLLKLNVPVDLGEATGRGEPVRLGHTDDAVTFRFAALDFTDPGANRYSYMLEGFDRGWIDAGDSHQATYTNLPGGRYTFRVRASNSDGQWTEHGLAIPLAVDAPPWLRWWAVVAYVATFLLLLYAVWSAQQRKIQREAAYARRLAREVELRTAELADRNSELEHLNLQLHEASITDALTGLGNRRSLRDAVAAALAPPASEQVDACDAPHFVLMVIDLDRLKPVNDEFGHEAGDRVLKQVADVLTSLCRGTDHVCRWGGDEFVILCRDGNLAAAATLAERIRGTVAKTIFRVGDGVATRTSCSIGFATFPFVRGAPGKVGWEQVLALSDAALYQAKRERNMWVGMAGTPRAAGLDDLVQAVEADLVGLERDGFLAVRRGRSASEDDTIRRLVALASRGPPP